MRPEWLNGGVGGLVPHAVIRTPFLLSRYRAPHPTPFPAFITTRALEPSSSNFQSLAEAGKIVDKTQAIAEFLELGYPVDLLLRPRRSGKSTLLETFRAFFENRRNPAKAEEVKNLFINNKLYITRHPRFNEEFARYPKDSTTHSTIERILDIQPKKVLKNDSRKVVYTADRLRSDGYFESSSKLSPVQRDYLQRLFDRQLSLAEWTEALQKLTEFTFALTNMKTIVLIDEYDTPMSEALRHGYFEQASAFFKDIFQPVLKGNKCLRGALLVGILPLAKASWLSGLNNIQVYPLGEHEKYSSACMFTEKETQGIFDRQIASLDPSKSLPFTFDGLKTWYDGYTAFNGTMLFNPWSIGRALVSGKLGPHWVASGYDNFIEQRVLYMLRSEDEFRKKIDALLTGRAVVITIDDSMSYQRVPEMSMSQLWTLIYYAGYLTMEHPEIRRLDGHSDMPTRKSGRTVSVRIPNLEIRSLYSGWLDNHIRSSLRARNMNTQCRKLFEAFIQGDFSMFAHQLRLVVSDTMPYQILGNKEALYQSFMYAYLEAGAEPDDQWEFQSEFNAGMGRLDLMVWRCNDHRAVIGEYKRKKLTETDRKGGYTKSKSRQHTKLASEALDQIQVKDYRNAVNKMSGITKLHEYGIAFFGARSAVVGRTLSRERPGEPWTVTKEYNGDEDEASRALMYAPPLEKLA